MALKKDTKGTIIFISFNLMVVLIFLAFLEILLWFQYSNPSKIPSFAKKAFTSYYSQVGRNTIQVEAACAQYDPELFYLLKPGFCTFENIEFSTPVEINQMGLRDSDKALGSPEIIFLGDSFTMGWGVNQNEAFPQLVKATGKRALNAGVSSFGTVREMILLKSIAKDSLKTVVIQYHATDAAENSEFIRNNNVLPVSTKARYDSLCQAYKHDKRYYPGKLVGTIGRFLLRDLITNRNKDPRDFHQEAATFLEVLMNFEQLKLKKIVIFEVGSHNANTNQFINALEELVRSGEYPEHIKNAILIRLENEFLDNDYFILDDHLNAQGHQKLANSLLRFL
ncbi:MAG: hypothetical protein ABL895_16575 [Cyclobacteriaceae bacterium]